MNSVLNLNTIWTAGNFLNYIEHSFLGIVTDWYDSLNEEAKKELRMMETPEVMFKNYVRKLKLNLLALNLILKKKPENSREI